MSVLKQCDAHDHLSLGLNKSRVLSRRALADKAKPFQIASERHQAEGSTFAEDFTMEHSLRGVRISSVEVAGSF